MVNNNGSIIAIQSIDSIAYEVTTVHVMAKSINKAPVESKFLNFRIVFDKTTYGGL